MEIVAEKPGDSRMVGGEYTYLTLPPIVGLRSCVGVVLAGLATRAGIGIGNLEESIEVLEDLHTAEDTTSYRFSIGEERVCAEVWDASEVGWHTVVELAS